MARREKEFPQIFLMLSTFILLFSVFSVSVSSTSLTAELTLDGTNNNVYIPGTGEVSAGSLSSSTYTNPEHYYLASYLDDILYSLVFSGRNPISVSTDGNTQNHTLGLTQNLTQSNVFLVFSQGKWNSIDSKISMVEAGGFLEKFSPSFGFGLGPTAAVRLLLEYSRINIQGLDIIQKGEQRIKVSNEGTSGGKVVVNLSRVY